MNKINIMLEFEGIFKAMIRKRCAYDDIKNEQQDILQDFYLKMIRHQDKLPDTREEILKWCKASLVNIIYTRQTNLSTKRVNKVCYDADITKGIADEIKAERSEDDALILTLCDIDLTGDINDLEYFLQLESFFILNVTDVILDIYYSLEFFQKQIMLLRFVRDEKLADIAQYLNLTIQQVKNHIFDFRSKVRKYGSRDF